MATRTVANAGGNYNTGSTWVEGVVPTNADDVVFTATSGQLTVNVASACQSINFTNYTNTITFNNNLSVGGATPNGINLGSGGYTQAGSFGILLVASLPMTSNGVIWSRDFAFNGTSRTYTLSDNWTITGTVTFGAATGAIINGNTLNCGGAVISTTTAVTSGTANLVFNGTGTWSNSSTGNLQLSTLTFNTTGTTTVSGTVRYSGAISYSAGTIVTTSSTLIIGASTTLHTSAINWSTLQLQGTSQTFTLLSDINTSSFVFNGTTQTTVNGLFNINISGSTTINQAAHTILGTSSIVLAGTGSWQHTSTSTMGLNVTLNTLGTITFTGNGFRCNNSGTFTHVAGAIAGTTNITCGSYTFNCPALTWGALTTTSGTLTLLANLTCTGSLTLQTNIQVINGLFNLYIGGGLVKQTSGTMTGTATIILNGTGTWSDLFPTVQFSIPIIINTTGTITISGTVAIGTSGSLTYIAGTVITTSSTLRINGSSTLNTSGMTWNNVSPIAGTITLLSALNISNQLGVLGSFTFAGSFGFTCSWLSMSLAGATMTLPSGITNTVTTQMTSTVSTLASQASIVCSTVNGVKAILTLSPGATQDNGYLSATDIDSSFGRSIWTYKGTMTRTINWNNLSTNPKKHVLKYNNRILK